MTENQANPPKTEINEGTISFKSVIVKNIYGVENRGQMKVITRAATQVFRRALKRSGKIVGIVLLILPIAIFVHLLLLLELLALLAAGALFLWGLGDRVLFQYVDVECPACKVPRHLQPYGSGRLNFPITVHCADCGGTFTCILEGVTA